MAALDILSIDKNLANKIFSDFFDTIFQKVFIIVLQITNRNFEISI